MMNKIGCLIELEALLENILKKKSERAMLKFKILYFAYLYENLSVGMIVEKLGIKKTNFALMTKQLEDEGLLTINKSKMDKRCHVLTLTVEGVNTLYKYVSSISEIVGPISVDNIEHAKKLVDFLNKIV